MREARVLAAGVGIFLLAAPLLACARQATLLLVASVLQAGTGFLEMHLLPLLPVDPVYGGAGLRVLGGIEPLGLAVAGWPGLWLHELLPAAFSRPDLVADGAAVSALVGPGLTVLARVLAAILATSLLVSLAGLMARQTTGRLQRPMLAVAIWLGQIWLLLDLAHETDLSIRDLEATGLPFALAAFAPVDAHGQRVMLTSQLAGVPHVLISGVNALVAIISCLALAWLVGKIARLSWAMLGLLARPGQLRSLRFRRPAWPMPRPGHALFRLPSRLSVPTRGHAVFRPATLVAVALMLSLSPLRTLAEGETAIAPMVLTQSTADSQSATVDDDDFGETSAPDVATETAVLTVQMPAPAVAEPEPSSVTAPSLSLSAPLTPTPAPSPTASIAAASRVALEGSKYQYALRVNGRPWVVRGMGYNPWYASLPVEERQTRYRRDFSAMREIGVNTLEGWFQDQFDEVTLEEANRQSLKVIMPFELNQDYDYANPAIRARFRAEVTAWVLRYRDNPAVLMWGPGNEVMHRLIFPTAVAHQRDPAREKRADDFAAFYVELMDLIHELDPHHPVVYRDAEDLYLARFRAQLGQQPKPRPWFVYGTNVYTSRISQVIERWPTQGLDAPLLVSEFSPGGAGESDRPTMLRWYWSTIRAHPERVLGGVVYTWATRGPEDLDRVFGLTDESGAPVDGSLAALQQVFRPDAPSARDPT